MERQDRQRPDFILCNQRKPGRVRKRNTDPYVDLLSGEIAEMQRKHPGEEVRILGLGQIAVAI